jgi:hypothetical protein
MKLIYKKKNIKPFFNEVFINTYSKLFFDMLKFELNIFEKFCRQRIKFLQFWILCLQIIALSHWTLCSTCRFIFSKYCEIVQLLEKAILIFTSPHLLCILLIWFTRRRWTWKTVANIIFKMNPLLIFCTCRFQIILINGSKTFIYPPVF